MITNTFRRIALAYDLLPDRPAQPTPSDRPEQAPALRAADPTDEHDQQREHGEAAA